jgi:protein-disulfide isomerase
VPGIGRGRLFVAAAIALLLAFALGTLLYTTGKSQSGQAAAAGNGAALASAQAPAYGRSDAKVHIVEFLDPACETCAAFYPQVKKLIAEHPGRIRLSVRHVAFHQGSELAVRVLEAARAQDKYWETLEALLANQERWVVHHAVQPEQVWPSLAAAGLDLDRIRAEMHGEAISRRIAQDAADARALNVTKTPEYFVNGRPLPRFGWEPLVGLVGEELRAAYP